jgi:hypothetical protein
MRENAQVAAAVLTDVAQDPYGWRDAIGKGTPVSDAIPRHRGRRIDAFGRNSGAAVDVFTPAQVPEVSTAGSAWAGRTPGRAHVRRCRPPRRRPDADRQVRVAAQQYTRRRSRRPLGAQDPGTAFVRRQRERAVTPADFGRHAPPTTPTPPGRPVRERVAGRRVVVDKTVEIATAPLPGLVGDGVSALVDQAIDGTRPGPPAGRGPTWWTRLRPAVPRGRPPGGQHPGTGRKLPADAPT